MFAANRIQKILSMIAKLNENELDELMSKLNLDDNEPADGENSETETMSEESEGNDNTETTTEETAETEETEETETEAEERQSEEATETTVDDETGVEETASESESTETTENSENDTMREMIAQMVNEAVAKAMEEFKSNDSRKSKEAGEEEAKALNKLESIYN